MDAHVSTLCGNIVGIPHGSSMRVLSVVHHSTYEDTWHCGSPIHLVSPLAINVVLMEMMASVGTLRLSTYNGHLLQDHEVIPKACNFFKLVWMKQVDNAGLGHMSQQDAHNLNTMMKQIFSRIQLLPMGINSPHPMIEAELDRDDSLIVAMSGINMVIGHVYGEPLLTGNGVKVLGILHQHANTQRHCVLKQNGVDPTQINFDHPIINGQISSQPIINFQIRCDSME